MSSKDKSIGIIMILVGILFIALGVWGMGLNKKPNNVNVYTENNGVNVYTENNNGVNIYNDNI